MAVVIALKTWTPAEAAEITGVSPDLQRAWRKYGVSTPMTEEGEKKRRTKYDIIRLSYVLAARALIDNGVGYKDIQGPLVTLGTEIMYNAVTRGHADVREPVTHAQAQEKIAEWGVLHLASSVKRRYVAVRNDPPALGSTHRILTFDRTEDLSYWLEQGVERADPEADSVGIDGEPIPPMTPEELAEHEQWLAENPPEPPLPRAVAAVVLDAQALADQLLERIGLIYIEVYDDHEDPLVQEFEGIKAKIDALNVELDAVSAEHQALVDAVLAIPEGPERDAALALRRADLARVNSRHDELMAAWGRHQDELKALLQRHIEERGT